MSDTCQIIDCEEYPALMYLEHSICTDHFDDICSGKINPNDDVWKD